MTDVCPTCGESFERYGVHWSRSECPYPDISERQHEVVTGLLMGDGTLDKHGSSPRLHIRMIKEKYLEYLDSEVFGILSTGVYLDRTADEKASENRETGFDPGANSENYSDVYGLRTRHLPELEQYSVWYESGEKVFPERMELTPTTLLHWYIGDGNYDTIGTCRRIRISVSNEIDNRDKIENYFRSGPEVDVSNWSVSERKDGSNTADIYFTVEATENLFDYMEKSPDRTPLPGFEYKWPDCRKDGTTT